MDDIYRCPDCHAEHAEPLEATLGHIARCLTCAIEAEAAEGPAVRPVPVFLEIHIAA